MPNRDDPAPPKELAALPKDLDEALRLDDADGPARPLDRATSAAMLENVVEGWQQNAEVTPLRAAPRRRRRAMPLVVGGAMLLGIGSAAALFVATRPPRPSTEAANSPPQPQRPSRAPVQATPTVDAVPPQTSPPAVKVAPDEPPEPAARAQAPTRPADPGALLARANRLRGQGRYRAAERAYLRALKGAPHGPIAHVARVAAADLRRERLKDPRGAIALYRRALSAPGSLSAEAHRGIALSERALNHPRRERQALEALLAAQPDGAASDWARRRLSELTHPPADDD